MAKNMNDSISQSDRETVDAWLDIYKRGITTPLILAALEDSPKYSKDVEKYVETIVDGGWAVYEKSMHRALRRLAVQELIEANHEKIATSGLTRKVYRITPSGTAVLLGMRQLMIRV